MIGRNDECWCGSNKKWKKCHYPHSGEFNSNDTHKGKDLAQEYLQKYDIYVKSQAQITKIKAACKLASKILDQTCAQAQAGVSTQYLNDFAHNLHIEAGAIPAPLHYGKPPYPKSICTSLNDVICHGIPNDIPLKEGDILNIDVTCILDGYYGDCSRMVAIGPINKERQLVVDVSYECLMRSIAILKPNIPVCAIGEVIEDYAAAHGCSVVNQFVGHGVGLKFHEGPQIPHHFNNNQIKLIPGMTFTIEPMINAGVVQAVIDQQDGWTARTADRKASAQWEHTVCITEHGYEILTTWTRSM